MREVSKPAIFMNIAEELARLGTCDRNQVGALIVHDGRCVSWGYNGAPPGLPHCDQNNHGWGDGWGKEPYEKGCRNATHAEANAIAFAARQGISTEGAELFVTVSPCDVCARLIIAAGIVHVYYDEAYRATSGIQLLYEAGLAVTQV